MSHPAAQAAVTRALRNLLCEVEAERAATRAEVDRLLQDVERLTSERDEARATAQVYREHYATEGAAHEATRAEVRQMRAQVDAFWRAKDENDERFMIERDEARSEVARLRRVLAVERSVESAAPDGWWLMDGWWHRGEWCVSPVDGARPARWEARHDTRQDTNTIEADTALEAMEAADALDRGEVTSG